MVRDSFLHGRFVVMSFSLRCEPLSGPLANQLGSVVSAPCIRALGMRALAKLAKLAVFVDARPGSRQSAGDPAAVAKETLGGLISRVECYRWWGHARVQMSIP